MLGMSVVHGMRGVGRVCEMYMCLALASVEDEGWVLALPIMWEQGECWMCAFFCLQ